MNEKIYSDEIVPNKEFFQLDSWRVFRMMAEIVDSFEDMNAISNQKLVSVFGSARTKENSPYYNSAYELGKLLVKEGYGVITGGGNGIMGAANKGASEAKGCSIGLNIKLPMEQKPNEFQTNSLLFRYFFIRKVCFLKYSTAIVVYPGGFGTLDEFSEVLTMIQTKKINPIPIILVGKDFWSGLLSWFKETMLEQEVISAHDMDIFKLVDNENEAIEYLKQCHRFGTNGTVN